MGGDAKCVQHKIVLPMYVSYTSIPTSTANTTMKSTKLLTNPYLDVTTTTSTNAATCNNNQIKPFNDHNHQSTNNRNLTRKPIKSCANSETNPNIIDHCNNTKTGERNSTNCRSMSFNPYQNGAMISDEFGDCITKNIMTNPMRSLNTNYVHDTNGVVYRKSNKLSGTAYMPRSIRYSDSDDTRSSSIDYNFNYVKFRSPLNATATKTLQYRDSSTTSTLATDCGSLVAAPSPLKHFDDDKKSTFILPKVHNHPSCKCGIQNCCPFAERFVNPAIQSYAIAGVHDRKCFTPRYPYKRRDLNMSQLNYDRVLNVQKINDSPPEYDQIDDFLMKRTFSHDRLFTQRRVTTVRNRTRPKSYCANHYPAQL